MKLEKNFIIKILQRYSEYLLPFIAFIFIFILIPFQIIPTIKNILSLRDEISSATVKREGMERKLAILSEQDSGQLHSMLDKVNLAIPTTKDIPSIFGSISGLSLKTSVVINLTQINVGPINDLSSSQDSRPIEFQTSVGGTISQTRQFLELVEQSDRLFKIRSVTLQQSGENVKSSSTENLVLNAYYLPLPRTMGKIDDPITSLTDDEKKIISLLTSSNTSMFNQLPTLQTGKTNPFSP